MASGTLSLTGISGTYQFFNVSFATPITVNSGTKYAIILDDMGTTNFVNWQTASYANGKGSYSATLDGTYVERGDFYFITYANVSVFNLNSTINISATSKNNFTFYVNESNALNSTLVNWSYKVFQNNLTYNISSYETITENFIINLSANTSLTAVTLNYDGVDYSATNLSDGRWSREIVMPFVTSQTNKTFYWKFTYAGSTINSDQYNQTVNPIVFGLCNATLNVPYLNLTFKDETTLSNLNGTISSSTFYYWISNRSLNKSYTYINNTENARYSFCFSPSDKTYNVDPYVQFSGLGYPQRIWNPEASIYTNTTTVQPLYLLSSSDGIYVTFQVVNTADQLLEGVLVTAVRNIDGNEVEVARGLTSASGTVVFWLSPDFEHTFNFSKIGYPSYSFSEPPAQSSYTIILNGGNNPAGYDYSRGITYYIEPKSQGLMNDTTYNFNYTITSSYWDISSFGFSLVLPNGTVLASQSLFENGGTLNTNIDTKNYTRVIMNYYYIINSTYINGTTYWNVMNSENTQWSIKSFFTDFNAYMDSGMFGIDNFGRYLIIFIVLFTSVGIMSYKYGLTSPLSVVSMIFAVIFFFDVVLNLLPTPINAIPHSLTYLALLILIVLIVKESQQ